MPAPESSAAEDSSRRGPVSAANESRELAGASVRSDLGAAVSREGREEDLRAPHPPPAVAPYAGSMMHGDMPRTAAEASARAAALFPARSIPRAEADEDLRIGHWSPEELMCVPAPSCGSKTHE